jgi:uncharacterized NAD(P)/FAD-binding protein YdhS
MRRILIIGGGASGILVAIQLAIQAKFKLSVTIAEPSNKLGRGLAYSTLDSSHLLNVPAGRMSALADQPNHFCDWSGLNPESFAQRLLYGEYLEATFNEFCGNNSRVKFDHLIDRVISITKKDELTYFADFEHSNGASFDAIVLALGHGEPISHPELEKYRGQQEVIFDSWRDPYAPIDGTLLCIGTGLTFIDHALSHIRSNPENKVIGISRTGALPKTHLAKRAPALGVPAIARTSPKEMRTFVETSEDWRAAQDGVRHELPNIWNTWNDEKKIEFLSLHQRWWNVHRHRLSPEIDSELQTAIKNGSIKVLGGDINGIIKIGTNYEISTSSNIHIYGDSIINCLGYQVNGVGLFLKSIIDSGLVMPDPLGMGIRCNYPNHGVLDSTGIVNIGLYALGPILLGERYETTAIPELKNQAKDVATELIFALH